MHESVTGVIPASGFSWQKGLVSSALNASRFSTSFSIGAMYDFMEYCLRCYYRSTGWREENQYSNLCSWSRTLLDFYTPRGLSLYLSKLPTPQFKPSYTMNALPSLNGSIGYLYTSQPLDIGTSATVDFQDLVDRFRIVEPTDTNQGKYLFVSLCYTAHTHLFYNRCYQSLSALWSYVVSWITSWSHVCSTAITPSAMLNYCCESTTPSRTTPGIKMDTWIIEE